MLYHRYYNIAGRCIDLPLKKYSLGIEEEERGEKLPP